MAGIDKHSAHNVLNDRAQHLLKTLIQSYIKEGQPVGSRTLSRASGLDLSAASVRNVMADLEELGYIQAPHTSAGRVPTARGYRFFVDSLLQIEPLRGQEIEDLRRQLKPKQYPAELAQSVSSLLSEITHLAGVVTVPRRIGFTLRQVEFLPLSGNRVLVILVINEQEVENRIIRTERDYTASELQQAANYLNSEYAGRDIHQARTALLGEMSAARETVNRMMQTVIEMADKAFEGAPEEEDYILAGQTNLMEFSELADLEKLRHLFDAFNRKRAILHLLDQCLHAPGVHIFIGEESGFEVLGGCSVVTAPYVLNDGVLGALGVIGPTRMAYERVIPLVEVTAKLLAAALNSQD